MSVDSGAYLFANLCNADLRRDEISLTVEDVLGFFLETSLTVPTKMARPVAALRASRPPLACVLLTALAISLNS